MAEQQDNPLQDDQAPVEVAIVPAQNDCKSREADDLKTAQMIRELSETLGYPSDRMLMHMLKQDRSLSI